VNGGKCIVGQLRQVLNPCLPLPGGGKNSAEINGRLFYLESSSIFDAVKGELKQRLCEGRPMSGGLPSELLADILLEYGLRPPLRKQ